MRRPAALALITCSLMVLTAERAAAVVPGVNGSIVFTSGRAGPDGDDSQAKLYLRSILGSSGGGSVGTTITPRDGVVHRHPSWSPDRRYIAYAAGATAADPNYDIYLLDLTRPTVPPVDLTNTPTVNEDRPAWSPDGRKLAYDSEVTDGSNQSDLMIVFPFDTVPPRNLTNTPALYETKATWMPDGNQLWFAQGNKDFTDATIKKIPYEGGTITQGTTNTGMTSEYQPALSPDGTKVCYTLGTGMNNTTDIVVENTNNPVIGGYKVSTDTTNGDINCVWSPDGRKVAWTNGIFSNGALVMANADGSGGFTVLTDAPTHFDGNADWAVNGSPTCDAKTASTAFGTPVTVGLTCVDTGPAYERDDVQETVGCGSCAPPAHGRLSEVTQGDPSTIVYTPDPGFSGTDTFVYDGFDLHSFGPDPKTVTVTVSPKPPETGGGATGTSGTGGATGTTGAPPPFPAKLEVTRATVDRARRRLDVLAPITARASGSLQVALSAGGRTVRFAAPITGGAVRISRALSPQQARQGTGILTLTYPGDADTQPQTVRLRAASGPARLRAGRPAYADGRVQAAGTISSRAGGVVRLQLLWEPAGQPTRVLELSARIARGSYRIDQALPADVAASIATRQGVLHSYTLFTGDRRANLRGELASYEVLPTR